MKWLFQWVALLVVVLVQVQLPSSSWLGGMKCPLVLACVLYYALAHERGLWISCALLGGLLFDSMSDVPLGYSSCLFLALGWVASRFRRRLVIEAAMTSIVLGAILNFAFTLFLYVVLQHTGLVHAGYGVGVVRLGAAALLGAVSGPMVCGLLGFLEHALGNRERSTGYA